MHTRFIFLLLLFSSLLPLAGRSQTAAPEPVANSASVVASGNARFTVLTPSLIRMEWNAKGVFEDRASLVFINRNLPPVSFQKKDSGDWLEIKTASLTLRYKKNSGRFSGENLQISFSANGKKLRWVPGMKDSLNLKGTTRTLDNTDGSANLEDGILSRSGWALVDDSDRLLFDGNPDWNWVTARPEGEKQDWYFFGYGHDYKRALYDYTRVAGKIPMPPKFAFGYWWSRYWTYSDAELRGLIDDFKTFNIPMDVLIIDMDWHNTWGLNHEWKRDMFGEPTGWTGYTWNRNLFPEPEAFLSWVHSRGLKTALNLHPASGIAPMESQYDAFAKAYGFDTTGRKNIPFKIEDKKWVKTYFGEVLHPLEKQGVDFWWLDWQQWLENRTLKGLSNTWWLNYVFFTDKEREDSGRPLLFHRWGGLGNHRYQIGFSGDTRSTWASLAYQPYFTATASNVGYGYWSHDIGGHVADNPDPELYLRWIQYGVFSPVFRTHSAKSAFNERRIWKFPDHYKMMLKAFQLRYSLNPYIYTASREAYDSGISICRPMYYDYPEAGEAYSAKDQYMFGEDMIVAPVTAKSDSVTHLAKKKVWLPEGKWFDYFSGSLLEGNRTVENSYTLSQIPVFIKAGSIIPMYGNVTNLQHQPDTLMLTVIPGGGGDAKIYEDGGNSEEYKNKGFSFTEVKNTVAADGSMLLTVYPRTGSFEGMHSSRSYEIRYPSSFPPAQVIVNGKQYAYDQKKAKGSWTYMADGLTTVISVPETSCSAKLEIEVVPSAGSKGKEKLLYQAAGLFSRLPQAAEDMKYESAKIDWVANSPDCILALSAVPSLIQYHPEQTLELIERVNKEIIPCLLTLKSYPASDEKILKKITDPLAAGLQGVITLDTPVISISKGISLNPETVTIISAYKDAEIHYTLDGSLPEMGSPVYKKPFVLSRSTLVKARVFRGGDLPSFTASKNFIRTMAKSVGFEKPYSEQYSGGGPGALIDGVLGEMRSPTRHWVGFSGDDMVATIELNTSDVGAITTRFLQIQDIWVFLPSFLKYEVSSDGVHYETVFEKAINSAERGDNRIAEYRKELDRKDIKFIRITAKNTGICPEWHQGAGKPAWLFTDEVVLE